MAVIRPFKGLRYSATAGPLEELVAPPYDVLSQAERDEYAAKNPHNVVHLTLPESKSDDRSKFVKYGRSAASLAEWRRDGTLAPEESPAFYRYRQTFGIPGEEGRFTRTALIALIKTEPYEKGVVLPHEQTFPKHKEDRLRLLEATRAHLECIFGLFEDTDRQLFHTIDRASARLGANVTTDDGVEHVLELVDDPDEISQLASLMADRKVWIADGHHRYETACTFRAALGERSELIPEDFMMMALSSMSDPGLVLLPTHRILAQLPVGEQHLDEALQSHFNIRKNVPNRQLMNTIAGLANDDTRAFGIALPSGSGMVATLDRPDQVLSTVDTADSDRLKLLDVTILHKLIFEKLLGVQGLDSISYTRDPDEAVRAVEEGAGAAFLMNPPTVQDMREIALGGEKMPQKSTYYYPKILSGLTMWSLNDFEA